MVKKNYQDDSFSNKNTARVMAKNQPVSLKYSLELLREIKGKPVLSAESFIKRIIEKKDFLPLRKYKRNVGHRKGKAKSFSKSGRYPIRLAGVFLKILSSLKANADYKGMDAEKLLIRHVFASAGFKRYSGQTQGRISGKRRRRKSTHIEIIAVEAA